MENKTSAIKSLKPEKTKKTFRIAKEKNEKLNLLRNYFNRSFDSVLEQLIENAYLRMNEDLNANATEELKETAVKMSFQYQQIALEIGRLKEEIGELRNENINLKESQILTSQDLAEQTKLLDKLKNQVGQLVAVSAEREKNHRQFFKEVNDWIKLKDKSFISKVKNLWEK